MKIETVLGSISPEILGITLPHEHVFMNNVYRLEKSEDPKLKFLENSPVTIENLWAVRKMPSACKDNLIVDNSSVAIEELRYFKKYGGKSVVDLTPIGFNRNIPALRKISLETGLNIIVATGYYRTGSHPEYLEKSSVEELTKIMMKELREEINNSGVKAGVIKCAVSTASNLNKAEKKILQAAAQVQKETNSGLTLHPSYYVENIPSPNLVEECLDVYLNEGGNPEKFFLSHSQGLLLVVKEYNDHLEKLLNLGVSLVFDFGLISYPGNHLLSTDRKKGMPNELERIDAVVNLCNSGYDKQVMLSHDVYLKMQLKKFGGYGYSHLLETAVPILKKKGATEKQINNMLIENPKRILQK